jgi:hypothetical protein
MVVDVGLRAAVSNYPSARLTFVMVTITGTLNARAIARCSLDIPINPAFAPTMSMTQSGEWDVIPYSVVLRYRSCPARSKCRVAYRFNIEVDHGSSAQTTYQ